MSEELRVAWMVDRFYSGDDFRQLGVMKVNVLDQFSLCIRWSGDENCAGVRDRFSDLVKQSGLVDACPLPIEFALLWMCRVG